MTFNQQQEELRRRGLLSTKYLAGTVDSSLSMERGGYQPLTGVANTNWQITTNTPCSNAGQLLITAFEGAFVSSDLDSDRLRRAVAWASAVDAAMTPVAPRPLDLSRARTVITRLQLGVSPAANSQMRALAKKAAERSQALEKDDASIENWARVVTTDVVDADD
jgi:hypothetical protein